MSLLYHTEGVKMMLSSNHSSKNELLLLVKACVFSGVMRAASCDNSSMHPYGVEKIGGFL